MTAWFCCRRCSGTLPAIIGLSFALASASVRAQPASQPAPVPDQVFATVNGEAVTYATFYNKLQDMAGANAAQLVILETLRRQAAAKAGIVLSVDEVDARLAEMIAERFGGDLDAAADWMADSGLDENALREIARAEIVDLRLRTQGVTVTDADARKYFADNQKTRYTLRETVQFREIVSTTKDEAKAILDDLNAGKISFFEAAATKSISEPTAPHGGLVPPQIMELFERTAKPLADAIKPLKEGEYTKAPVEFEQEWYLLQLVKREPGRDLTFEDVATRVRRDYLESKAVPTEVYYSDLADKAQVNGLAPRYFAVQAAFGPRQAPRIGPTPDPGAAPAAPAPTEPAPAAPPTEPPAADPAPAQP